MWLFYYTLFTVKLSITFVNLFLWIELRNFRFVDMLPVSLNNRILRMNSDVKPWKERSFCFWVVNFSFKVIFYFSGVFRNSATVEQNESIRGKQPSPGGFTAVLVGPGPKTPEAENQYAQRVPVIILVRSYSTLCMYVRFGVIFGGTGFSFGWLPSLYRLYSFWVIFLDHYIITILW